MVMRKLKIVQGCLAICLIAGIVLVGGCSSPSKAAPKAEAPPPPKPASLAQIRGELLQAKSQIDATTNSLNALQKSSTADAQANYDKFTSEYTKLQTQAEAVKERAEDLKKKTTAYWSIWNKQVEVE